MGTELMHGLSSPDWRLYAGVNWQIGPTYEKKQEVRRIEPKPGALPDEPSEQFVIHDILFEFDSATLVTKGGLRSLNELADHLKKTNYQRLVVEGHTDSIYPTYPYKASRTAADWEVEVTCIFRR